MFCEVEADLSCCLEAAGGGGLASSRSCACALETEASQSSFG